MSEQINVEEIGKYLIKYCFNMQVKGFSFKRKDSKSNTYKVTILMLDNTTEKLLMEKCENCDNIAVFTSEGSNAEYPQTLCRKCEEN